MFQSTYTTRQLEALKARGAKYLTVVQYGFAHHQQGNVLSWHKNNDAAQRAARSQLVAVMDINDAIFDAKMRDL